MCCLFDEVGGYLVEMSEDGTGECDVCDLRVSPTLSSPSILPSFFGQRQGAKNGQNKDSPQISANYRKYGVISFVKAEDSKKPEKKDVAASKKGAKVSLRKCSVSSRDIADSTLQGEVSGTSTPVPAPPKLPPCACCRRMEPKSMMARCKNCTFSAHSGKLSLCRVVSCLERRKLTAEGCYGIASQDMGPEWLCELCANAEQEDNHLVSVYAIQDAVSPEHLEV